MSAFLPSSSVSDGLEDQHCLPWLADPAGTLTVITTILRLRTGSCIKKYVYRTKNLIRNRGNKTTCNCKHKMPIRPILRSFQNFPRQKRRIERILERRLKPRRGCQASVVPEDNLRSCLAPTRPPTNNPIIITIQPSPISSAIQNQVVVLAIQRLLPK